MAIVAMVGTEVKQAVMENTVVAMVVINMDVVMERDQLKLNQDMDMDQLMYICTRLTMDMAILNHTATVITLMEVVNYENVFKIYQKEE